MSPGDELRVLRQVCRVVMKGSDRWQAHAGVVLCIVGLGLLVASRLVRDDEVLLPILNSLGGFFFGIGFYFWIGGRQWRVISPHISVESIDARIEQLEAFQRADEPHS